MKQIKSGLCSENQIQKKDNYCAAYCVYVLYRTQLLGFKNAPLNFYYQVLMNNKGRKLILIQLNSKLFQNNPIKIIRIHRIRIVHRMRKN